MKCNICGGGVFSKGPGKRVCYTGKFPRCCQCASLERHRAIWSFFGSIKENELIRQLRCLHFAPDGCVSSTWFRSYETSTYHGENTLDLCKINCSDNSYDLIICNHVLEHVVDDKKAIQELMRVVSDEGIVFLSVPISRGHPHTVDWGFSDKKKHGHYRIYGEDVLDVFSSYLPFGGIFPRVLCDPVTGVSCVVYILFPRKNKLSFLFSKEGLCK